MTNRELATTLQHIKNERRGGTPHDVWVKRNRDILLMQVRNTTDVHAKTGLGETLGHLFSLFMPMEGMMAVAHGVGVFLLVIGTVLGGGLASAQVYRNAAPGEMLYNVKVAVERAQLFLAPNEEYKTTLHAEFADRRIDEATKLAEESAAHQMLVPGVLAAFNKEVQALADGLQTMKVTDPEGVAETAKLLERKMAVYQNELRKTSAILAIEYQTSVADSRDLVDGTTLKAIAVIVDKHLANANAVSRNVVVNKFQERIQMAEANLEADPKTSTSAQTATTTKARAAIAEAKKLLKDEDYKAALSKIEEVAQLTKEAETEKKAEEESEAKSDAEKADATVTPTAPVTDPVKQPSDTEQGSAPVAPVTPPKQ